MRFLFLSLLLVLLVPRPTYSTTYTSLDTALGDDYTLLLMDTNLAVLNPSATIQALDFSEIFVWDANTIFVGASNYILKLNADFVIDRVYTVTYGTSCTSQATEYLDSCDNFFRVFLNIDDKLYTCYTNRDANPACVTLNPATLDVDSSPPLFEQVNDVAQGYVSPSLPALLYQRNFAIFLRDNSNNSRLVTGSVFDSTERNRITVIDPFINTAARYITTTFYYFDEDSKVRDFLFAASFAKTAHNYVDLNTNNYIYFMFYEPAIKQFTGTAISRIARFCLEGPSDTDSTTLTPNELPQMQTFLKGELECGNVFPSLVQDWLYVPDGANFLYYAIFSSLEKGPQTSYLCIYSLDAIRAVMDLVKECAASTILETMNPFTPVSGGPSIGYAGALFTQIQRYTFDLNSLTYEMIYISLTNGSIIKYCLSCSSEDQLIELTQVVPTSVIESLTSPELSAIDRLQLNGDHLIAGGYTGLYKVPLETCSLFGADYTRCLCDPMCYYDLDMNLCMAVTVSTTLTPSILHFTRPVPSVSYCSSLTGNLTVNIIAATTDISYSWTCYIADSVNIVLSFSDGSSDVVFLHEMGNGSVTASISYLNLTTSAISSFSIQPFISRNSISRALPGTPLISYVTYDVIQQPLLPPTICTPLPPSCTDPVCVAYNTCPYFCTAVQIDCSAELANNPCADGVSYTLGGGSMVLVANPDNIIISSTACESCLFQAYTYNTTTNIQTIGTSHWLNLISPSTPYPPILQVDRDSSISFSFSAIFAEISNTSCISTSPSSPITLTTCSQVVTAMAGSSTSQTVFSSQPVLSPVSVQLNLTLKADIDECTYSSDVTVTWQHPDYVIPEPPLVYMIEGTACSLPIGSGVNVTGTNTYICTGMVLSYNTEYNIRVTSFEPCFKQAAAVASLSTNTSVAPPGLPIGLGYTFSDDDLLLTWTTPVCLNSYNAASYRVVVYRSPCTNRSSIALIYNNITSLNNFSVPLTDSSIYAYNISVRAEVDALQSPEARLVVFSPVSSNFSCLDCRVMRVNITSELQQVTCESTSACDNYNVAYTNITLTKKIGDNEAEDIANYTIQGGCTSVNTNLSSYISGPGLYTVSIKHNLQHECSDAECTTENSKAFYNYVITNYVTTTVLDPPTNFALTSTDICQDDKAYIILGLAAVAILCAVGNLGFMCVAFCVFCVPRRKIFRCC